MIMASTLTLIDSSLGQQQREATKRSLCNLSTPASPSAESLDGYRTKDDSGCWLPPILETSTSDQQSSDDCTLMANQNDCLPRQKRTRRVEADDDLDTFKSAFHDRRNSKSSFTPMPLSGHKKSRNRAFTGEDFERLIISQI